MAEAPGRSSPTLRRRQLGAQLRALRIERRFTVEQVADQLLVSPSKISRMETGQRNASQRDIRDLADLYEVDDGLRQQLFELAQQAKQRAWWQPLHLPYGTFVGLEAAADSISDFSLTYLPGLLQTEDYARAILRAAAPAWEPELVDRHLRVRMTRQEALTSGTLASYQVVMDEALLHRVVGGPAVMAAQVDRLIELSRLQNVALHIAPYSVGALPWSSNKFIILDFADPTVSSIVFVETLTQDLYLDDAASADKYHSTFRELVAAACSEDETVSMLRAIRESYRR